jgi:hypothetical protein
MQSKFLFILILVPSLCSAAFGRKDDALRQVSPPALAASALTVRNNRNEGTPSPRTPSPRTPLGDIQRASRPLTPVQQTSGKALGIVEEGSEEAEEKQEPRPFKKFIIKRDQPLKQKVAKKPTEETITE